MEENKKSVLFVAMSHRLTAEQIESARNTVGIDSIVLLSDLNPLLAEQISQIPAHWEIGQIINMAKLIAAEADKIGATHFCCLGQPALFLWANLIASGKAHLIHPSYPHYELICIESTTERQASEMQKEDGTIVKTSTFRHLRWRKIFE